jgi:hypothetical protein
MTDDPIIKQGLFPSPGANVSTMERRKQITIMQFVSLSLKSIWTTQRHSKLPNVPRKRVYGAIK